MHPACLKVLKFSQMRLAVDLIIRGKGSSSKSHCQAVNITPRCTWILHSVPMACYHQQIKLFILHVWWNSNKSAQQRDNWDWKKVHLNFAYTETCHFVLFVVHCILLQAKSGNLIFLQFERNVILRPPNVKIFHIWVDSTFK